MSELVLITGGAGFIGSHLADELLEHGYRVRALDSLSPQVHPRGPHRPEYLSEDVELHVGDVRDSRVVHRALEGVGSVFHLASVVGVGQSMYEIARYTSVNNLGTAVLLEAIAAAPVRRLVVASSMSVYGEGLYADAAGGVRVVAERTLEQLQRRDWEHRDGTGALLTPVPTPEDKPPALPSIYALSKYDQERMCLIAGRAYGIDTVVLRFFNAYGTRQALSNPYTGVLAIFASRLLNDRPPLIFEDGEQLRDFVSVRDVARACRLSLEGDRVPGQVLNIASGRRYTIRQVAELLATALGKGKIRPEITGNYRVGDVRHCFADISAARQVLGYEPRYPLEEGLGELAKWLKGCTADDRVAEARQELAARGLTI